MNTEINNHVSSYSSVYAIGHKMIADIFRGPVEVTEKIDGSQFSMVKRDGQLYCRSKGQQLLTDAPEKMFLEAVETANGLNLREGWTYRCEYLQRPKHNTLKYERIPLKHLMVYGIDTGTENYMPYEAMEQECCMLGLEPVPVLYIGEVVTMDTLKAMLERTSILGGCKIEGVVVKNYSVFTPEKKIAVGKLVSDSFKEKHRHEWKKSNPTQSDVVQHLIVELRTEARWRKAVQHLRDAGKLTESPKDIGAVIKEVAADVLKEESDEIKECLFKHFWPQIQRGITSGVPEWYKAQVSVDPFASQNGGETPSV